MALSGSIHGSSSLQTTAERNKLDENFGYEKFSPTYEAYMSTDIGRMNMVNYDNFYINGLYSNMNVAKTNYHIRGMGNTAIFAVCRGSGDNEDAFEQSRRVFEFLDEQRNKILEAKSLSQVKDRLRKFTIACNDILTGDLMARSEGISMVIVVYAFSGAVYMSSGDNCRLYQMAGKGECKLLNKPTERMGIKKVHSFEIKRIKYILKNQLLMNTQTLPAPEDKLKINDGGIKEKVIMMMHGMQQQNPERNHTCIAIETDQKQTIKTSTKITALICAVISAVSLINILIQSIPQ